MLCVYVCMCQACICWGICVLEMHICVHVCKCAFLWLCGMCLQVCVVCLWHMCLPVHLFVFDGIYIYISQWAFVGLHLSAQWMWKTVSSVIVHMWECAGVHGCRVLLSPSPLIWVTFFPQLRTGTLRLVSFCPLCRPVAARVFDWCGCPRQGWMGEPGARAHVPPSSPSHSRSSSGKGWRRGAILGASP